MFFKNDSDETLLKEESDTTFFKKRSEVKPVLTKKKVSLGVLILMSFTLPLVPVEYVGNPLWNAWVLMILAGYVYLHWFMKD